jgi:2-keto-4-pentenoate hydratase/2-oxohepta-3-ene-1,7-dioic acid hydratase in catechol pathway
MKLVRFDGGRTGVLDGDRVVEVPDVTSWTPLIRGEELTTQGDGVPLSEVTLEPPLPDPAARIFAMGGNFPMHTADTEKTLAIKVPDWPWGFYVIPGTIVGDGAEIRPPANVKMLDYEAEVGVVLDDSAGIWGWTAWNDFSMRDPAFGLAEVDRGPLTWSLQKNFATANACGPWMVVGEPLPAAGLRIVCRVNGEVRQDGNTRDMKHDFDAIAAHIGAYLPLGAGDMILSGTPPGTAIEGGPDGPFLADGDEVEVEVDGAGVLRNRVVM